MDKETWGDVMIQILWDCQVDAITDYKLGNADETMTALLSR